MATIPLFNNGGALPVPAAEGLSRVPTAKMQLDYGGLAQSAAKAYQQPLMPKDMYEGDRVAGEAWGQALQTLGKSLGTIALEEAKIQNERDIFDADIAARQSMADYRNGLATNQDPRTWVTGFDTMSEGLMRTALSKKGLSPYAKRQIEMRLGNMIANERIELSSAKLKENLRQVNLAYDNFEQQAVDVGNVPAARGFVEDRHQKGYISEAERNARLHALDRHERGLKLENLIGDNVQSARMAATLFGQRGTLAEFHLNEVERQDWLMKAERAVAFHESRNAQHVLELVVGGDIRHEKELEIWKDDVSPLQYRQLTARLRGHGINDPANLVRQYSKIGGYNARRDSSGVEKERLKSGILLEFDGEDADELLKQVDEQAEATAKGMTPMLAEVSKALKEMETKMDSGGYGIFQIAYDGSNIVWDDSQGSWKRAPFSWEKDGKWQAIVVDQVTAQRLTAGNLRPGEVVVDLRARSAAAERAAVSRLGLLQEVLTGTLKPTQVPEAFRKLEREPALENARRILNTPPEAVPAASPPVSTKRTKGGGASQTKRQAGEVRVLREELPDGTPTHPRPADGAEAPPPEMQGPLPSMEVGGYVNPALFDHIYEETK